MKSRVLLRKRFIPIITVFIAVLFLPFANAAHAGSLNNQWTSNGPYGGYISAIAFDKVNHVLYAGTQGGGVFKGTYDSINGWSWSGIDDGLGDWNINYLAIDETRSTLYAATANSGVFKLAYGESTWSLASHLMFGPPVTALALNPTATGITIYAGTDGAGIFRSKDGGTSWCQINIGLGNYSINALAIDPSNPLAIYAGTNNGGFWSTNGGDSWNQINSDSTSGSSAAVTALAVDSSTSPATIYAGVQNNGVFKCSYDTSNNIWNWSLIATGTDLMDSYSIDTIAIDPGSSNTVYAVTDRGVFKGTDGGSGYLWSDMGLPNTYAQVMTIDHPSGSAATLYAGTGDGVYTVTDDSVTPWSRIDNGLVDTQINSLAVDSAASAAYAATRGSGVFKTTDGGATWSPVNAGFGGENIINSLAFKRVSSGSGSSATYLYAATGSWVFMSTSDGAEWSQLSFPSDTDFADTDSSVQALAIDPNDPSTIYVGTSSGKVYMGSYVGSAWNWIRIDDGANYSSVESIVVDPSATPAVIYAGTTGNGMFKAAFDGSSWNWIAIDTSSSGSPIITYVYSLVMDGSTLYAAGYGYIGYMGSSGVFKSTDGGDTWSWISNGMYSPRALALDPAAPNTIYAAGSNSLYVSRNGGDTWGQYSASLTNSNVTAFAVDSSTTPATLYAGTWGGGVNVWNGAALPTLSTTLDTNVTYSTATAGGSISDDGGDPVTEEGVCLDTAPNPTQYSNAYCQPYTSSGTNPNPFSILIDGLSPNTTYFVAAYAKNAAGTGYGQDESFTTPSASALTVDLSGAGRGKIEASSGSTTFYCGGGQQGSCEWPFAYGSQVTLKAYAAPGSVFSGWSGSACSGTGDCVLTLPTDSTPVIVGAEFETTQTIQTLPASINFGNVAAGSSLSREIKISNSGVQGNLTISSMNLSSGSTNFFLDPSLGEKPCGGQPTAIAPGSYCTAVVTFIPSSSTIYKSTLSISSDDPNVPTLNLPLSGSAGSSGSSWSKTYGGTGYDLARFVQKTNDGGYIVAGGTYSGSNPGGVWIFKLDSNGVVEWQNTYAGSYSYDSVTPIQQTSDGGYIFAGATNSSGDRDVWILKLLSDGSIDWQKTYGGTNDDYANSVQQTADGGYIVAGSTSSSGAGSQNAWILKLKPNGDMQWQKTYGGTNYDSATFVQQTSPDGGYVVLGQSYSFGGYSGDTWILKLDPNGAVQWQNTYGSTGSGYEYANAVQQTSDGGYVIAGGAGLSNHETESDGRSVWVAKLDQSGNVVWQNAYGGTGYQYAYSIKETSDGGFILCGATYSYDAYYSETDTEWISKLSSTGEMQWLKSYGNSEYQYINSIQQAADGGYIAVGEIDYSTSQGQDAWVLKLDSYGNLSGCTSELVGVSSTVSTTNTDVAPASTNAIILDTLAASKNSTAAASQATTSAGVICTGTAAKLSLTPPSYNFNNLLIGSSAVNTFTILNPGTTGINVTNITLAGDADFVLNSTGTCGTSTTLASGANCTVDVSFNPSSIGLKRTALQVYSSDPDMPLLIAAISGSGTSPITTPTVTTASISSRTSTMATGGGTVTSAGGGTISARGVCWNTAGSPSNSDTSSTCTNDGTGTGTFTSTLIPLAPATTYHVRAYATNEAGTAYDTTDVVFETLSSYSLSTQASPSTAGSIGLSPAGGVYDSGTPVQLTATPASGYMFSQWSGDLSGSANPAGLTMNGNKSVTAIFVPAIYTLTVVKQGTGSGSVTPDSGSLSWSGSTGTGSYALNTTVTLTASADTGSSFSGWSGCDSTNGNACTVLMSNARSVSATFNPVSYTISGTIKDGNFPVSEVTVTLSGNGSNTTLTTGATGTYSFSEPNGTYVITPSRAHYSFTPQSRTVTVNGSNKTGQDFSASTNSGSVTIKLPGAATTTPTVNAYRMISIPVMPTSSDVFETLSSFWGGAYDPSLWRLYGADGTEITKQGDDTIDYGKAWWIISTDQKTLVISGSPLAGDYECQVAPGYQMIGSPYPNVNVSWSSVCSDPFNSSLLLGASVYSWNGSGEYVTVTSLEPGKAYWVWSQSTGTMRMLESYGQSTNGRSGSKLQKSDSKRSGALSQQVIAKRIWLNQPPPPLSPAASIEVKSPKQGAVLRAGSQCLISWKAVGVSPQGFSSKVEISYSVDGGKSYALISSKNSSGGSLRWKVPNAPSGQCVVKVTSSLYPNVSASSGVLTIK